jgi:hypothetical protein
LKTYFLTFASSDLEKSLNRISNEARNLNFYDSILSYTESDLDSNFKAIFNTYLKYGVRGFGYWSWKPQVILQVLNEMEDGDILQYSDVGCYLNKKGLDRLCQYFELTKKTEKGILAFQNKLPEYPLKYDGREMLNYLEYEWVKGDLIDYFNVRNNAKIINTPTIGATVLFIRKCEQSVKLINEWLNVIKYDFHFIDDTKSKSPNMDGFIEHRHDQSIFSILCKLNNVETLSAYEYYYPSKTNKNTPDWSMLSNFPIWAKRDKKYTLKSSIIIFIWRLKKYLNK